MGEGVVVGVGIGVDVGLNSTGIAVGTCVGLRVGIRLGVARGVAVGAGAGPPGIPEQASKKTTAVTAKTYPGTDTKLKYIPFKFRGIRASQPAQFPADENPGDRPLYPSAIAWNQSLRVTTHEPWRPLCLFRKSACL